MEVNQWRLDPPKKRQQLSIFQVITSCIFHKSTNIFTSLISCHFRYESCESIEFGRCVFPPHIFHSLLLLYTMFYIPLNLFNFRKFGGRFMCVCVCVLFSLVKVCSTHSEIAIISILNVSYTQKEEKERNWVLLI